MEFTLFALRLEVVIVCIFEVVNVHRMTSIFSALPWVTINNSKANLQKKNINIIFVKGVCNGLRLIPICIGAYVFKNISIERD